MESTQTPPSPEAPDNSSEAESNTLSLTKGEHHFRVRYGAGEEVTALTTLVEMAETRPGGFDWFDAAVLSHQLGRQLAKELKAHLPKKAA